MTSFKEQQDRLRYLANSVGFGASWRNITSQIALEMAMIEERKSKNSQLDQWLEIATILESRNK